MQGRVGREAGHDENFRAKFSTPWIYINTQSARLRREESANRIKMSIARNGGIEKKCLVRKPVPTYMYMTLLATESVGGDCRGRLCFESGVP